MASGTDLAEGTAAAFHVLIDIDTGVRYEDFNTDLFYAEYISGPSPWANHSSWSNTLGMDTGTQNWPGRSDAWLLGGNSEWWPYRPITGAASIRFPGCGRPVTY